MHPSIDAARAMLPAWVQWANLATHAPIAYAATLFASLMAAAASTPRAGLGRASSITTLNALALLLPLLWAGAAATAAGPLGRAPWWLVSLAALSSSLTAVLLARRAVRQRLRRAQELDGARDRRAAMRGALTGVALTVAVAVPLRAFAGQAWSPELGARVFAVAFTGGHDRTLADLAWTTAQRGDQAGAAVLLQAAMVAEASAVPAANLAIVYVNEGRCREAAEAAREARRRAAANPTARERSLMHLALDAVRGCEGRGAPPAIMGGI